MNFKNYFASVIMLLALLACASIAALGQCGGSAKSMNEDVSGAAIGQTIAGFDLPDIKGSRHSLTSLKGKNGTVVIFISVQCPISNAYNERMEKLARDYQTRGINVIGINSNATEPIEAVRHHAAEHQLTFPILKDKGNRVADELGAQHTPEAFLLDSSNKLVYRGRIDNAKDETRVNSNDLRNAMEELLAGKAITKNQAKAFGCSIKRVS